jgi:hypothetical protein
MHQLHIGNAARAGSPRQMPNFDLDNPIEASFGGYTEKQRRRQRASWDKRAHSLPEVSSEQLEGRICIAALDAKQDPYAISKKS